jgi:hypothetical protein
MGRDRLGGRPALHLVDPRLQLTQVGGGGNGHSPIFEHLFESVNPSDEPDRRP